jgi:UDP-N-acetyl-D-glucosamine dehydrogenase
MRAYDLGLESIPLSAESLGDHDLVLIATDHDAFDFDLVLEHAKLIVDTRGVYRKTQSEKVVRA